MVLEPQQTTVGFIGIGVMGKSMARHLMNGGCTTHIYTRTKAKAEDLVAEGAVWEDSVASLAAKCQVIFTIVGFPPDVEEVYLGESGILANMKEGGYVVDMTTSRPDLAARIFAEAEKKNLHSLDAPVSGGDIGAREARLSIMVGGEEAAFAAVLPLFELMGKNIVYQGKAGSGQHTKMCNQIAIAAGMMGICESLAYAEKSGLDPKNVLKSIETGAAGSWSLSNLAPRIIDGDYAPGFFVKHFIKDMTIAIESADAMGLDLPGLKLARQLYQKLAEEGGADNGTQALFKLYR
ncbi:NAD(P)-dependent oxidoreductase [Desulfosediminicola sp.]|uniref:NAD(P)-dependent oxidoreductase n=1 Tax=Desulfosediminicola sp. TaxID=2886825 RepID=UPI003AF288FA